MDIRFNMYKVKYDVLDVMTRTLFNSQHIERANIFISLDDILYSCKNSQANHEFQCCGKLATRQLVSNILNIVAHYREWVVRKKINVRMFVYYTNAKIFENRNTLTGYRDHYNDRSSRDNCDCYYVNTCIHESAGILPIIFQHIEGAYIVDTRGMEPTTFPYLCATEFHEMEADWNFVISKDMFEFQYAYLPKFSVIYPKGDNSELITAANLWEYVAAKEKVTCSHLTKYPVQAFPVALAVVGDKKRSIPKIKGISWRGVCELLDNIIEDNPGLDDISYTTKLITRLEEKKFDLEVIQRNIDVVQPTVNAMITNDITKANIRDQFIDMPDYNNLVELNRNPEFFADCPINISFLTRQYEVKQINPFKLSY